MDRRTEPKRLATPVLDRIEINHYVLPELEDGLSGLFIEMVNGKSFRVEFNLASGSPAAASGMKIRDARNSGLVTSVSTTSAAW